MDTTIDLSGRLASLRSDYQAATPYPHCVIDAFCDAAFLRAVYDEALQHVKTEFKETDLFKVFQSQELGGVADDALPQFAALRRQLYSPCFRQWVSAITGCDDLTDRIDCSLNAYAHTCHLLCHDDVIGSRRVSYILYLTDPTQPWRREDGGALELYALEAEPTQKSPRTGVPAVVPSKLITPTFNSLVMFAVQPGRSFHAVQEVFSTTRPRLSISGWFHGPGPLPDIGKSSLAMLSSAEKPSVSAWTPLICPLDSSNAQHMDLLQQWISPEYLSDAAIDRIAEEFCANSSVQLQNFLRRDRVSELRRVMAASDLRQALGGGRPPTSYSVGQTRRWHLTGPAHVRRYLRFDTVAAPSDACADVDDSVGALLSAIQRQLLISEAFASYLRRVSTLAVSAFRAEVRRFRCGLDYTVAHHGALSTERFLDATLCFVADVAPVVEPSPKRRRRLRSYLTPDHARQAALAADAWDDGEVGGFECYIEAESGDQPAEVYRSAKDADEDETTLLSVAPRFNSLSLVLRDEGIMKFVKYLNADAPSSRWDICMEYKYAEESESS